MRLFLADAERKARAASKKLVIDEETAYQVAYQSMLKASLALMLSYGQRPRVQLWHHQAIIKFAARHLGGSHVALFALFDRMRRKRNDAFYDVAMIGAAEAEEAVAAAENLIQLITADVEARFA